MGAWGTGIFEDDRTCDVQDDFNELLDRGQSVEEATALLLGGYLAEVEEFEDEERQAEESLVYIALAALQLRHRTLQESIRERTLALLNQGGDLSYWEEAKKKDYEQRKAVLEELKRKLMKGSL
ncbi:DUF4259 domain-containing protein [Aneurinibacillus migulanus]|uniref:DUF4259 domain-containing protein n=1 Tax=Aneurinibacillus migulanus TaxID=47500 RepID=UPI002E1F8A78|nr:DUF4259 domain-containing protein [Aneurinibacillus migulanus]